MSTAVEAIDEGGVLRPLAPLPFVEHARKPAADVAQSRTGLQISGRHRRERRACWQAPPVSASEILAATLAQQNEKVQDSQTDPALLPLADLARRHPLLARTCEPERIATFEKAA